MIQKKPTFSPLAWKCPGSYSGNHERLPHGPGIYAIVAVDADLYKSTISRSVVYIGKSSNLANRLDGHPILSRAATECERVKQMRRKANRLSLTLPHVEVYFRQFTGSIDRIERKLISAFNPRYNIQHNREGVKCR